MTAALSIVANENCYHPIQDVLNGLVWDGTPRIRSCLHHFLGADESDYVEEMLKHFLLGAIRRVFSPGCKYEEMLRLVGGQGAGKSSFFRLLAIRDEWFSDDLKKLDDDRVSVSYTHLDVYKRQPSSRLITPQMPRPAPMAITRVWRTVIAELKKAIEYLRIL